MSSFLKKRADPISRDVLIEMIEDLNRKMMSDGMADLLNDWDFDTIDVIDSYSSISTFYDVVTEYAPTAAVEENNSTKKIVRDFVHSGHVLLCRSSMVGNSEAGDSRMFSELLKIIYEKSGWVMVAWGEEDCINLGDECMFCLVRDVSHQAVQRYTELQLLAGYEDFLTFHNPMVNMRSSRFNNIGQSWRDWSVTLFPLTQSEIETAGNQNGVAVRWTNDRPLWELVEENGVHVVRNNAASKIILDLLDDTTELKNRLVQQVTENAQRIKDLEMELEQLQQVVNTQNSR